MASARNHGIWYASYDYIGFLDADDAWKPDFLAIINDLIKKYPRAGAYGAAYEFVHSMPVLNAQRLHLIYTIVLVAAAA